MQTNTRRARNLRNYLNALALDLAGCQTAATYAAQSTLSWDQFEELGYQRDRLAREEAAAKAAADAAFEAQGGFNAFRLEGAKAATRRRLTLTEAEIEALEAQVASL
jgi:hypothetical protein